MIKMEILVSFGGPNMPWKSSKRKKNALSKSMDNTLLREST